MTFFRGRAIIEKIGSAGEGCEMAGHDVYRQRSRKIAVCGLMSALGVVFLMAGAVIPFATYCAPVLAMLTLLPVLDAYGPKTALWVYAAVSLLGLLLAPETEAALWYVCLGYYPVLRPVLRKLPGRLLPLLCKLLLFNTALVLIYGAAVFLFDLGAVAADIEGASKGFLLVLAALANVTFLLYDVALGRVARLYRQRWRKFLFPKS